MSCDRKVSLRHFMTGATLALIAWRRDWHRYEPADSDVNQYGGRLSGHLWFGIKCKLVLFSVIEK